MFSFLLICFVGTATILLPTFNVGNCKFSTLSSDGGLDGFEQ